MISTFSHTSAYNALAKILSGELKEAELRTKFFELVSLLISTDLLVECATALREKMVPVNLSQEAIDTCGTGGSGLKTINTSTLTALIVAAAGGKVAKHGNRSASGNCGCFNLLEHLGVCINLTPEQEQKIFEELGIVFLFAPAHHPSLKFIAPLRKEYGKKTLFNLIGPLCNPAGVTRQMIGTGNAEQAPILANAMQRLGSNGSLVVCGDDGLDEVTSTTETTMYSITSSGVNRSVFSPAEVSVPYANKSEIEGGTPKENAEIFLRLIQGHGDPAKKNLVLLNAAHAFVLAGVSSSIQDAFVLAKETLASGKVHNLFQEYRELTSSH